MSKKSNKTHEQQGPAAVRSRDGLGHLSKACRKCGVVKPLTEYYHGGRDNTCKPCYNQQSIAWAKGNPEKVMDAAQRHAQTEKYKAAKKRYRESPKGRVASKRDNSLRRERHPQRVSESKKRAYAKKRGEYLRKTSARQRRQVESLHDEYVKDLLLVGSSVLSRDAIPQSLVELKRAILKNKRICRNQKTSMTSETNCSTLSSGSNKTPAAQTK